MSNKKYYLFSNTRRCQPCMALARELETNFPEWRDYIEYVDSDFITPETRKIARDAGVKSMPTITDDHKIVMTGGLSRKIDIIKKLCIKE